MRLFLSSYLVGLHPQELVRLAAAGTRAAIIMNAADHKVDRAEKLEVEKKLLSELGYVVEELDLRNYFGKSESLEKKLSEFGLVWVRGGNAFILKRAFEESGFIPIIKRMLADDSIVYAGYSAGVVVCSPTLEGIEIVDPPDIVPPGYKNEFSWEGMNLIPYAVAVHYKSDHDESALVDKEIEYYEKNNISYKTLRDGEALVIEGEKETIFTLH